MKIAVSFLVRLCTAMLFAHSLAGCADIKEFYERFSGNKALADEEDYVPVPGQAVSKYLSKTLSNTSTSAASSISALDLAIQDQAQTNLIEMGLALADSESGQTADSKTFDELVSSEKNKKSLDPTSFLQLDSAFFKTKTKLLATDYSSNTVNWGSYTDSSFTISVLDRMPIREQGRRGTCGSFAGIGLIEALILKNSSDKVPFKEVDLSEQRFYYLSKPDSWSTGGSTSKQGSDSGSGFMYSSGELSGYARPTDTGSSQYNIPLESQCKYNPNLGDNDLQIPLADSCKSAGIVRVQQFSAWAGAVGTETEIDTAQQIYDELRRDKPVIVYTKLSSNWEKNDGMVTYKASGGAGASSHAAGHAYLLVGAKKISDASFPDEGGICFIAKNSWGTGWGVKGLSCITLTWFNRWRFDGPFPTVESVQLTTDAKNSITLAAQRPSQLTEPDPATKKNVTGGGSKKRKGKVVIKLQGDDDAVESPTPYLPQYYAESTFVSKEIEQLTGDDFQYGRLISENDQNYKILYIADTSTVVIRGILDGDQKQTHSLSVDRIGNTLTIQSNGRHQVPVGEITALKSESDGATAVVVLCGQKYASTCDLHYADDSNELVIGLSELEAKKQVSEPPYNWESVKIANYGFEISRPGDLQSKFDMRMIKSGKTTNPVRLKLNPLNGKISHKGNEVGNLTNGNLCSGSYRSKCRVLNTDDQFDILQRTEN
jgi:hypothetical protein